MVFSWHKDQHLYISRPSNGLIGDFGHPGDAKYILSEEFSFVRSVTQLSLIEEKLRVPDKNRLARGTVIREREMYNMVKLQDVLTDRVSLRIVKILKTTVRRLGQGEAPMVFFFGCGLLAQVARAHP